MKKFFLCFMILVVSACTSKKSRDLSPQQQQQDKGDKKNLDFPPVMPPKTPPPALTPSPEAPPPLTSVDSPQIFKPETGASPIKDLRVQSTGSLVQDQNLHKEWSILAKNSEVFFQDLNQRLNVLQSFDVKSFYLPTFEAHYEKNVTDVVKKKLFFMYDAYEEKPQEITSLGAKNFILPWEKKQKLCPACKNWGFLHEDFFKNSRSLFINRSKEVFENFHKIQPLHEQGVLAKKCAFLALEEGLKTERNIRKGPPFIAHDIRNMEVFYITVLAMQNIVEGQLDVSSGEKSFYEFCTQKDLFTGENLHASYVSKRIEASLLNTPRDMGTVSKEQIKQKRFIEQKDLIDLNSSNTLGGLESFTKPFTQSDIQGSLQGIALSFQLERKLYNVFSN